MLPSVAIHIAAMFYFTLLWALLPLCSTELVCFKQTEWEKEKKENNKKDKCNKTFIFENLTHSIFFII